MPAIKKKTAVNFNKRLKVVGRRLKFEAENYCQQTTLHGFKYVTAKSSSPLKAVIWFIITGTCIAFCLYMIYLQLKAFQAKRVTTSIATTAFSIYRVPFPAVTICNHNIVFKNNTDAIMDILQNQVPDAHITDFLFNLSTLVLNDNLYGNVRWKSYQSITQLLNRAGYNTETLMKTLAQPCESLLVACKWNNKEKDCKKIFRLIKTTFGFCCSFNYKNEIDGDRSLLANQYVSGVGPAFGLEVSLNIAEDQYISAIKPSFGLAVSVHEPYHFPDMSLASVALFPEYTLYYAMNPNVFTSDLDIRTVGVQHRGCWFSDERETKWSGKYSFSSCISECKVKAIAKVCKCMPYYYPMSVSLRFCTVLDAPCLKESAGLFSDETGFTPSGTANLTQSMVNCKCLPQCNEVAYPFQVEAQHGTRKLVGFDGDSDDNQTMLNVFYNVVACTQFKRSISLTWDSLLASLGGIFGLCMGGSIISLIELFYYFLHVFLTRPGKPAKAQEEFHARIYVSELYPRVKNF